MGGVYAVSVGVWLPWSLGLDAACAHARASPWQSERRGGSEGLQESVCGLVHMVGGDGLRHPRSMRWGGGVQWVQEDLLVSGLLKLSCSLPALCWHQAVSPTQELVVPTALEGPQSFLFLRDGSRWKDQEG